MNATSSPAPRPRVALFVTCVVDTLYPRIGTATVDLLEGHGAQVMFPAQQTCCGQPAFNAGYRREARDIARHAINVFWPLLDRGEIDAVVAPSGSCVAMVRHMYRVLFEGADDEDRRRALRLSQVTYELTEYLVDVLGAESVDASYTGRLTYHPCCHLLRELRVDAQPRRLLAQVRDAEIVELPDAEDCCGFGGTFAVKNSEISTAMGRRKVENLSSTGAEAVVMCDASCMTHVNGILSRGGNSARAVHIAEVLSGAQTAGDRGGRRHGEC